MSGSQWRKWNMHVHTKGTNKNDQFRSKNHDEFFEIFFKKAFQNNVHAVGITDYFSIENYLLALEYRKNIHIKVDAQGNRIFTDVEIEYVNSMFIFPNVELRMLPTTGKGKLINIHCIFNPEYVVELENAFFNSITNEESIQMNRKGIVSYGKASVPHLISEDQHYQTGVSLFVVDLKSLKRVLANNANLKRNTIIVVSNMSSDGVSGTREHYSLFDNENGSLDGVRKSIYRLAHAVFSSNEKDIKYFLGKKLDGDGAATELQKRQERANVIFERGSLKACIVGCDAHTEEQLFTRHTWLKCDLTFEGLRQIIYEPEQRVKISESEPDFKEDRLIIEQVRFISGNNYFSAAPIKLNKNLNVIIGGKSSGKSILLYNIAKTLLSDKNILVKENIVDKYSFKVEDENYNFEIKTKGGFSQLMYRSEQENSLIPDIKYIPQNYLSKLAEPEENKRGYDLNRLVRSLIMEDQEAGKRYNEFITQLQLNDRRRDSIIDNYFSFKEKVTVLENQLSQKTRAEILLKNIATNEAKVQVLLAKKSGVGEIEVYNELQRELQVAKESYMQLSNDFANIASFNKEVMQIVNGLKQKRELMESSLRTEIFREYSYSSYSFIDNVQPNLETINSKFDLIKNEQGVSVFRIESEVSVPFNKIHQKMNDLSERLKPFMQDEAVQAEISMLQKSIETDKLLIQEIDQLTKEVLILRRQVSTEKESLFTLYAENYQEYVTLIQDLKSRVQSLEHDGLIITGLPKYNFPKLQNIFLEISDNRSASYRDFEILNTKKSAIDKLELEDLIIQLKKIFESIVETGQYALKRTDTKTAVKHLLEDNLFDYWEIEYKKDKLGAMSTGKASFVILMMIVGLSKSKAPILIDQPEDNLDNRSISSDLVEYLRKKKLERQIILVTHNPNIVVNADAENVIVAHQLGQDENEDYGPYRFDYVTGSLENTFPRIMNNKTDMLRSMGIKEHIADIVEGGKDAFIKREVKYGFKD